ncbi:hypothetical protein Misp01_01370 [Microtetraspora sp. NBRC 13810]|uniref:hypothetical protein n=1 Tax=Microtetraspora sp. NBRC 13810 TaxID=3030990 RepID=UPI0024A506AE|nr:hypothetical protein [Microtetraspora sp. NBRC 13810]GLW05007.1 hypothetical protein Misp01_01370 [Microtetraspora sp. NBRC 13810]
MAINLDKDWPGLEQDDAGGPDFDQEEIRRIAGELAKVLEKLTTPTQPPATQSVSGIGVDEPPPPLPPDAGSLPDVRLQCAISDALGEWMTAQQFGTAISTAYSVLIGENGNNSGLYAALTQQFEAANDAVGDIARNYNGAEVVNQDGTTTMQV